MQCFDTQGVKHCDKPRWRCDIIRVDAPSQHDEDHNPLCLHNTQAISCLTTNSLPQLRTGAPIGSQDEPPNRHHGQATRNPPRVRGPIQHGKDPRPRQKEEVSRRKSGERVREDQGPAILATRDDLPARRSHAVFSFREPRAGDTSVIHFLRGTNSARSHNPSGV